MGELGANADVASSSQNPGFWRRLLLRGILVVGVCLLLFLAFLIAITVPNLRIEVVPPVISGPKQISQSSGISDRPTSKTLSVSTPTSGTAPLLNLDDFPHLSPTIRKLAQVWLDQCVETDKALAAISDPVLRAQAVAYLKGREEKMRAFLNQPLEWGNGPFKEIQNALLGYRFYNRDEENSDGWSSLLHQCPEFAAMYQKEHRRASILKFRLTFEFGAERQRWDTALDLCVGAERISHLDYPDMVEFREMSTWDEEVYCWRQIGPTGLAGLTARSYQRALDDQMREQPTSRLYHQLRMVGDVVVWTVTTNQAEAETEAEAGPQPPEKNPD